MEPKKHVKVSFRGGWIKTSHKIVAKLNEQTLDLGREGEGIMIEEEDESKNPSWNCGKIKQTKVVSYGGLAIYI